MMGDLTTFFGEAIAKRREIFGKENGVTDAYRLIHGTGDGFPGITVDTLNGVLLIETHRENTDAEPVIEGILDHFGPDIPVFLKERWCRDDGRRTGSQISGPPTSPKIIVREHELCFAVNLLNGEHIGLFLDSRPARQRIRDIAKDARVLNLFSYTGGFGVAALAGAARSTTNIDNKKSALSAAKLNYELNHLKYNTRTFLLSEAFRYLSRASRGRAEYEIVVLDPPPKFKRPQNRLFHVETGYSNLVAKSVKVLKAGGVLLAGLNYGKIDDAAFLDLLSGGLKREGRISKPIELIGAGEDFPYCRERPTARFALCSMAN